MLEDSAHIQVGETEQENKRRLREGLEPRVPLYTVEDVRECFPLFKRINYSEPRKINGSISVRYLDAGHILGSAFIEMFVTENGKTKKIVFSGDVGQWNNPIIKGPTLIEEADYLLIESTYGDRLHEETDRDKLLLQYVKEAYNKGGKLMIPSFAIDRTQELLYAMNKMIRARTFPDEKVYLDSPLAMKATRVFEKHRECFGQEVTKVPNPFEFKGLIYTEHVKDSVKLNDYNGPCVIIAGSGMCTGGRIRHHFKHGLWNKKNTVLFVGYQAEGTLGRYILEGSKKVRMMGIEVVVNADIRRIGGFSAHSDYEGLLRWAAGFKKKPKRVFVMHGEPAAAAAFKEKLEDKGFDSYVPHLGETTEL
jgi:metallo-beta-lactamase family protein